MLKIFFKMIVFIMALSLLSQCSNDDQSKEVEIFFSPENPIVIPGDKTFTLYIDANGDPVKSTITAPWIQFSFKTTNKASKAVVIQSMELKFKGIDSKGVNVEGTSKVSTASLFVNQDDDDTNDSDYLAYIPAGQEMADSGLFFVGSLPPDVLSGVFNVEVEVVGWFGDPVTPEAKYRQKYYFTTQ